MTTDELEKVMPEDAIVVETVDGLEEGEERALFDDEERECRLRFREALRESRRVGNKLFYVVLPGLPNYPLGYLHVSCDPDRHDVETRDVYAKTEIIWVRERAQGYGFGKLLTSQAANFIIEQLRSEAIAILGTGLRLTAIVGGNAVRSDAGAAMQTLRVGIIRDWWDGPANEEIGKLAEKMGKSFEPLRPDDLIA